MITQNINLYHVSLLENHFQSLTFWVVEVFEDQEDQDELIRLSTSQTHVDHKF